MRSIALFLASLCASLCAEATAQQATLYGRIVDALHQGVPAAEVSVSNPGGDIVGRSFTDGEGYYMVQRLPLVALRMHARSDGFAAASVEVQALGLVRAATLTLEDATELQGTVVRQDGTPVVGADVLVFSSEQLAASCEWSQSTRTADDGSWRLAAVPLRPLTVRVFTPGTAIGEVAVARGHSGPIALTMPIGKLYERRVQIDGIPAGLMVRVHNRPNGQFQRASQLWPERASTATVGADGVATMWPLPVSHELRIEAPGQRCFPLFVMCQAGDSANRRFALSPMPQVLAEASTIVRGQLVDELGKPLAGLTLIAAIDARRGPPCVSADDGSFELHAPVREKVLCRIGLMSPQRHLAGPDCELGVDGISWQTVAANATTSLRLDAALTGSIRCTLRGDDGSPFAAAQIELLAVAAKGQQRPQAPSTPVQTATDRTGALHVPGLPAGSYQLTACSQEGLRATSTITITAGKPLESIQLPLEPTGELTGVACDKDGRPVASAVFWLAIRDDGRAVGVLGGVRLPRGFRLQGINPNSQRLVQCDRNGRFRVPRMPTGTCLVVSQTIAGQGLARAEQQSFEVEASQINTVTITVDR